MGNPQQAAPGFMDALQGWNLETLEREEGAVFGLTPDLRLAWFSGGWEAFARANRGRDVLQDYPLGRCVLDCVPDPLQPWYQAGYDKALQSATPWTSTYECSSPLAFRQFLMTVYPLVDRAGLLVVNSLVRQHPIEEGPYAPTAPPDAPASGVVVQCVHCRRFRLDDAEASGAWCWIGAWLNAPPAPVSHGLCIPCMDHHYPPM